MSAILVNFVHSPSSFLMLRSSALCGLSFRARFGTKIGLLVMCADTGRYLYRCSPFSGLMTPSRAFLVQCCSQAVSDRRTQSTFLWDRGDTDRKEVTAEHPARRRGTAASRARC